MATQILDGDAKSELVDREFPEKQSDDAHATLKDGDATVGSGIDKDVERQSGAMGAPNVVGDAKEDIEVMIDDVVEADREKIELMIENARLQATLEGRDKESAMREETLQEALADKRFFREELQHTRKENQLLISNLHKETLEAIKAVSFAGRNTSVKNVDAIPGEVVEPESDDRNL